MHASNDIFDEKKITETKFNHLHVKIVPVSPENFDQTVGSFRKSDVFLKTISKLYYTDKFFFTDTWFKRVIFSDGKKAVALRFSQRPFHHGDPKKPPYAGLPLSSLEFFPIDTQGNLSGYWCRTSLNPIEKNMTINDLYQVVKEQETVEKKPEETEIDAFEKRYGRKHFGVDRGEPPEGFRLSVFQPTEKDDGKCVLMGEVIPPENNSDSSFDSLFVGDKIRCSLHGYSKIDIDIDKVAHLSREEFIERLMFLRRGNNFVENILDTELFFKKKIPSTVLSMFAEKTKDLYVTVEKNPLTNKDNLMLFPFSSSRSVAKNEKCYVLAEDPSERSFKEMVARTVTTPSPGVLYDTKKYRNKNVSDKKIERKR